MGIEVETYTTANGSNMDRIGYNDGVTVEEVAHDLRSRYDDWDYAIIAFDSGETVVVEREARGDVCSVTEAADILGVSRQRVHAMLQSGILGGRKVGKTWNVDRASVERRAHTR